MMLKLVAKKLTFFLKKFVKYTYIMYVHLQ